MRDRNHDNLISEQISAELQHVYDEWANDDHHAISQVTVTVWHAKDHFVILVMTDETAADSVSELHVTVHKAADDADVWKRKQMKQSHVSWHQEIMKDWLTDISAHEKNSAVI